MAFAMPKNFRTLIWIQEISNSYQAKPWRADVGCAWWLLCQPSPNVRIATHQLFLESSLVWKRRRPHIWVAEFTSQVECSPTVTRKNTSHNTIGHPPRASTARPKTTSGTQCQVLSQR